MTKHVLITGGNRGIGRAFVEHYLKAGWNVTACCREPKRAVELSILKSNYEHLKVLELDVSLSESVASLAQELAGTSVELLINNAGYYGPKGVKFGNSDASEWRKVIEVNTIAPLLLTEALYRNLKHGSNPVAVFISSKVGSMEDNTSGGGYYYRSSKAALNSVVKSLSIDLKEDGIKCVALHPGWVLTAMGGPKALIDTDMSVKGMMAVIDELTWEQSGEFYDYQGKEIPW
ncbi:MULTISPECIES: SDR family oxidoreductase [unclassified Shewanella]|uniref:SDR family oxidoreductase n=1 Tax=unclassified Shewanella TaxID=196818 RepID=UPI001C7D5EAD|nr:MULTISPECIES: SDR family oxidoreductase [unclassified Shewanella]